MFEAIHRAFRRTGPFQRTHTTLITYQPGTRVDWHTVTTKHSGEFSSAHHEWFDATGAHGSQYMTETELPEHLRGQTYTPEQIDGQYESMIAQLTTAERGKAGEEIEVASLGNLEEFTRIASRQQIALDDNAAAAVVEALSGSGIYHRD